MVRHDQLQYREKLFPTYFSFSKEITNHLTFEHGLISASFVWWQTGKPDISAEHLPYISSNLSWNQHIDRIVRKGNNMVGFLQRNLRVSNKETKASAYYTLVRPNLEYCASVGNPYIDQAKMKIEMVQWNAARYVTNRYRNTSSVTNMLEELHWESLESRWLKIQLTLLFKIMNDMVDIPATLYLTPASTRTRSNHMKKLRQVSSRTDIYKYSFFPRTIPTWNALPASIAEATDLVTFKQELSSLTF